MPCLIKETTVRQRKALEEGVEPETEIPCPRVSERGLCKGDIVRFSKSDGEKRGRIPREVAAMLGHFNFDGGMSMEEQDMAVACTIRCKDLEKGTDPAVLQAVFGMYGEVLDCKVIEQDKKTEAYVRFRTLPGAQAALSEDAKQINPCVVEKLPSLFKGGSIGSSNKLEYPIIVRNFSQQTTPLQLQQYFSRFGEVARVTIFLQRGVANVNFARKEAVKHATKEKEHVINGKKLAVRDLPPSDAGKVATGKVKEWTPDMKGQGGSAAYERAQVAVNTTGVWKEFQQGDRKSVV